MESLSSPVLTVLLSAIVGIITAFITSRIQVKTEIAKQLLSRFNERKWDAYMDFTRIYQTLLHSIRTSDAVGEARAKEELRLFTGKLWLVGSDDVVKALGDFIQGAYRIEEEGPTVSRRLFNIVVAMRRDLGYTSSRLSTEDFITAFVRPDRY